MRARKASDVCARWHDTPSGSLIVRFHAAGWTEMAWHLYQWGDTVEVLAPIELRWMVEGYRRSDFYPNPGVRA